MPAAAPTTVALKPIADPHPPPRRTPLVLPFSPPISPAAPSLALQTLTAAARRRFSPSLLSPAPTVTSAPTPSPPACPLPLAHLSSFLVCPTVGLASPVFLRAPDLSLLHAGLFPPRTPSPEHSSCPRSRSLFAPASPPRAHRLLMPTALLFRHRDSLPLCQPLNRNAAKLYLLHPHRKPHHCAANKGIIFFKIFGLLLYRFGRPSLFAEDRPNLFT